MPHGKWVFPDFCIVSCYLCQFSPPLFFFDNQESTVNENELHQKILLFKMFAFFLRKCNKSLQNTEKVDVIVSCRICW